jgi:hypothetical protein
MTNSLVLATVWVGQQVWHPVLSTPLVARVPPSMELPVQPRSRRWVETIRRFGVWIHLATR